MTSCCFVPRLSGKETPTRCVSYRKRGLDQEDKSTCIRSVGCSSLSMDSVSNGFEQKATVEFRFTFSTDNFVFVFSNIAGDLQYKRVFNNPIENDREYTAALDKRQRLARIKFEEHCEPQGKILTRICPTIEQCLSKPSLSATMNKNESNVLLIDHGNWCLWLLVRQRALRTLLEQRENANQFLHSSMMTKRFFLSSLINPGDQYNEKHVRERRRRGLLMYEDYCESTDQLPRACPPIDRCQCGDCDPWSPPERLLYIEKQDGWLRCSVHPANLVRIAVTYVYLMIRETKIVYFNRSLFFPGYILKLFYHIFRTQKREERAAHDGVNE